MSDLTLFPMLQPTKILHVRILHWAHEPAWYAVRKGRRGAWRGDRTQTTIWEVPNLNPMGGTRTSENAVSGHGTQKPVWLFEIRSSTTRL